MFNLADGLLHEVQRVLLPRDVLALRALTRAQLQDSQMAWVKMWVIAGRQQGGS